MVVVIVLLALVLAGCSGGHGTSYQGFVGGEFG